MHVNIVKIFASLSFISREIWENVHALDNKLVLIQLSQLPVLLYVLQGKCLIYPFWCSKKKSQELP